MGHVSGSFSGFKRHRLCGHRQTALGRFGSHVNIAAILEMSRQTYKVHKRASFFSGYKDGYKAISNMAAMLGHIAAQSIHIYIYMYMYTVYVIKANWVNELNAEFHHPLSV